MWALPVPSSTFWLSPFFLFLCDCFLLSPFSCAISHLSINFSVVILSPSPFWLSVSCSQWEGLFISFQNAIKRTVSSGNTLPISGGSCFLHAKPGSLLYFKTSVATAGGRGLQGSKPPQFKGCLLISTLKRLGKYTSRLLTFLAGSQYKLLTYILMWGWRTVWLSGKCQCQCNKGERGVAG